MLSGPGQLGPNSMVVFLSRVLHSLRSVKRRLIWSLGRIYVGPATRTWLRTLQPLYSKYWICLRWSGAFVFWVWDLECWDKGGVWLTESAAEYPWAMQAGIALRNGIYRTFKLRSGWWSDPTFFYYWMNHSLWEYLPQWMNYSRRKYHIVWMNLVDREYHSR